MAGDVYHTELNPHECVTGTDEYLLNGLLGSLVIH